MLNHVDTTEDLDNNLGLSKSTYFSFRNPFDYIKAIYWVFFFPQAISDFFDVKKINKKADQSRLLEKASLFNGLLVMLIISFATFVMYSIFSAISSLSTASLLPTDQYNNEGNRWLVAKMYSSSNGMFQTYRLIYESNQPDLLIRFTPIVLILLAVIIVTFLVISTKEIKSHIRIVASICLPLTSFLCTVIFFLFYINLEINLLISLILYSVIGITSIYSAKRGICYGFLFLLYLWPVFVLFFLLSIYLLYYSDIVSFAVRFFGILVLFFSGVFSLIPIYWLLSVILQIILSIFVSTKPTFPDNILLSRINVIPLPGLKAKIFILLQKDSKEALNLVNSYLANTLQFIPITGAINNYAKTQLKTEALPFANFLVHSTIHDWRVLNYNLSIIPFMDKFRQNIEDESKIAKWFFEKFFEDKSSNKITDKKLVFNASIAFYHLYDSNPKVALRYFKSVRHLPHGEEMYRNLYNLLHFAKVKTFEEIAALDQSVKWSSDVKEPILRTSVANVLEQIRKISRNAAIAQNTTSALARSSALNRATGELAKLEHELEVVCPMPERPYIKKIIESWREPLALAAGKVGEEVLQEHVENPYVGFGGRPVEGSAFIGRQKIISQIETLWATQGSAPTLFVYGHRRMGKTSILRNLNLRRDPKTLLVLLDMQSAASVDNTAQFYYEIALEVYDRAKGFGWLTAEDEPDDTAFTATNWEAKNGLDRLFRRLNEIRDERRLILAIDEFELIEERIREERIQPEALNYLRSLTQKYNWLALIFGGLLSIDEMGRDYRNAFFGSSQNVRVSYLSRSEAEKLITQPDPEFTLEYEPALVDELFRLTHGQPYLLQRICWELVNAWNEKFLSGGASTERLLRLSDLEPLLNDNFYRAAEYYFSGVWSQSTPDEKTLMRLLTDHEGGLPIADLRAALPEDFPLEEVRKRLGHRDVIIEESGTVRYAAELNRRWIAMNPEEN